MHKHSVNAFLRTYEPVADLVHPPLESAFISCFFLPMPLLSLLILHWKQTLFDQTSIRNSWSKMPLSYGHDILDILTLQLNVLQKWKTNIWATSSSFYEQGRSVYCLLEELLTFQRATPQMRTCRDFDRVYTITVWFYSVPTH